MLVACSIRSQLYRKLFSIKPVLSASAITRGLSTMSYKTVVDETISGAPVAVFSKSYCPYCVKVKKLLDGHKIAYTAVELDQVEHGSEMQSYLKQLTGQSTVPNVFIGGKHVGGCDDTHAAAKSGKLKTLLDGAGVSYSSL